ncbi:winged helix-turn-helix transcriptional regulator [Kitasatospora aburaviensis]
MGTVTFKVFYFPSGSDLARKSEHDHHLPQRPARAPRRLRRPVPLPHPARPARQQMVRPHHRRPRERTPTVRALQRRLQGVSPKVLTQTLRRLEDSGILDRTVYPAVPLHVEYSLTPLGQSAAIPLNALRAWVEDNIDHAVPPEPASS